MKTISHLLRLPQNEALRATLPRAESNSGETAVEIDVYELFKATPALVVFVVIGLGYFLGKLNIRGFELGPTGGVLLVGLLFGHLGFEGNVR